MGWRMQHFFGVFKYLRGAVPQSPVQGLNLRMPGKTHAGPLPPFTDEERALAAELRRDVEVIATEIGERNAFRPQAYLQAMVYLEAELEKAGYAVRRHTFEAAGQPCTNLDVELPGTTHAGEVIVIGAHYDSIRGCPAANDNGSGVAATLALARRFSGKPRARTIRLALFANEEPPFYWTDLMGSFVYAKACKQRGDNIIAMLTPETIGYYRDEPGSQQYPLPAAALGYPAAGNFIMFVGMYESRALVQRCVGSFRQHCPSPQRARPSPSWSRGSAPPTTGPSGSTATPP
jgi:hypothetical protein